MDFAGRVYQNRIRKMEFSLFDVNILEMKKFSKFSVENFETDHFWWSNFIKDRFLIAALID